MTTTLRPAEPEHVLRDGTRSRSYDICVNSRVVGGVRLRAEPELAGPGSVGRMDRLRVEEPDRRRGRATVAALAGEEVLRGWGCRRMWVSVPATAVEARQLAQALGYRETNCHLTKALSAPPELPPGTTVRPLTEEEFPAWSAASHAQFVESCVAQGLDRAHSEARSRSDFAELLPRGPASSDVLLLVANHRGQDVGTLWLALHEPVDRGGFVYSVAVVEEHRGRGHGRALMHIAEREVLAAGGSRLALNVFAHNTTARALYDGLGYELMLSHYAKPLL
ncbi:GNAT family N-acetyltransferase [Streptomyces sp. XM4193]|uniref:GNAT family N-acetyltransferase n=1 Tax=Streptomyces sp. XM4193 TaxID=2929782 RepID=UPI001FF81FF8|nr:GNAT family N-acetyltransferase [Streptomyces sp. XM4193]MCK1797866.1 GNAT family N-acetyltransferase [Streptomyces sp. XM4193]